MPLRKVRPMRKTLIGFGIAILLLTVPLAAADHDLSAHRTYEFGPPGDYIIIQCVTGNEQLGTDCDPTGTTQDGSIDLGGAIFSGEELAGFTTVEASIVDDVFGSGTVGFWLCAHIEGSGACDDPGELMGQFCGSSGAQTLPDGYDSFTVFVNGAIFQALDCDATQAPTSTSGGLLDPSGGIFLSFSH